MLKDQALGLIALSDARPHIFDESQLRLMQTISTNVGVAIENARLFQEEQQRVAELAIINSVQAALVVKLDVQDIYESVGDKIRDIEKTVQLSEQIMRVLILNAERLTAKDIEKETPAAIAEKMGLPPQVEESEPTEEIEAQEAPALEQDFDADNQDVEENIQPL